MDPETSMILPKGIVVNTKEIYDEIASHALVPADRVWEIWRVYTTTTKELQDPTARRLENFWWHVLGSDRRLLSGRTLARLFEHISLGPTAIPLRGPPNRWEGNIPPHIIRQAMAILEAEQQPPQAQSETALNATRRLKELSSSAAKPPPSHPILKKPSGPSNSGRRQTTRFVSPQPSEDEGDRDSEAPSSGSTITPGLEMRHHATPPSAKSAQKKKFVASSGAAKRRPVLPRKNSSQSSNNSDPSKDGHMHGRSKPSGKSTQASPSATQTLAGQPGPSASNPSAKALGKRPMLKRQVTPEPKSSPDQDQEALETTPTNSYPRNTSAVSGSPVDTASKIDTPKAPPESSAAQPSSVESQAPHTTNQQASRDVSQPTYSGSPKGAQPTASIPMAQSHSHSGFTRQRDASKPLFGARARATASTTNVAAQGTMVDQSGSFGSMPTPTYGASAEAVLSPPVQQHSGSIPSQPGPSAGVPLGRTKSQLTLLLDRGNEGKARGKPRPKS